MQRTGWGDRQGALCIGFTLVLNYFNFGCRPGNKWKAGPHTYRFGWKYTDDIWVEKKKYSPRMPINPSFSHHFMLYIRR
jgi:hypothetical protein